MSIGNYTEVRNLPAITAASSGANAASNAIGNLDDATSIGIFLVSTGNWASSGTGIRLQISQFDPAIAAPVGVTQSTDFYMYSSATLSSGVAGYTSSAAFIITGGAFRGIRLTGLTSATAGEKIAYVTKQITV